MMINSIAPKSINPSDVYTPNPASMMQPVDMTKPAPRFSDLAPVRGSAIPKEFQNEQALKQLDALGKMYDNAAPAMNSLLPVQPQNPTSYQQIPVVNEYLPLLRTQAFFRHGGMMTDGSFSHKSNPIDIVQEGQKVGEMTGGEYIINPTQAKKIAKESSYARKLFKRFEKNAKKQQIMSVLGTTVFQVPKLGETGFKIDQLNEAKRKQAQAKLEKEVAATGAEKAYMDNAAGLTGIYKQIADAEFQTFRQAAIEYEKTGSSSAEARMKKAAGELTYSVTAGASILETAGKEYVAAKGNGFKDIAMSAKEASGLYTGFINRTGEVIVKDGQVLVKDGDNFVPATQSTYLSSSVNPNNSFIMPRVVKQGTFVDPQSFMKEADGAISAGSTVEKAQAGVNTLFENKYENDAAFRSDVLTAYAISNNDGLGMVEDPNKISVEKYEEIQALVRPRYC